MLECLVSRGPVIVNLLHNLVSLSWQSNPGGLGVDDDEDTVGTILPDQIVDQNIILMKLGASVIPSDYSLLGIYFPKIDLIEYSRFQE